MKVDKSKEELRNEDPLAKEIDEMLDTLDLAEEEKSEEVENEDKEEKTEESPKEEVVTEPTKPNEEEVEEAREGEEVGEAPTEAPTEWEAERNELLSRIDRLTKMVDELSEYKLTAPKVEAGPEKKQPAEPKVEAPAEIPAEEAGEYDFLQNNTIDVLLDEEGKFNEVLNKVYQTAVMEAERKVFEKVLTSIPDIIVGHLNRQTTIQTIVREFYDRNSDLKNVKRTVAAISNDVHSEHPDWDVGKVLEEAAKRTREMLGITNKPASKEESPAFAKPSGSRVPKKRTSTLQDEIDELINF